MPVEQPRKEFDTTPVEEPTFLLAVVADETVSWDEMERKVRHCVKFDTGERFQALSLAGETTRAVS